MENTGFGKYTDSLPLCLVNNHCEVEPNRELLLLKLKKEYLII
jgi:hypothetical protein